jgi:hypothetical protein
MVFTVNWIHKRIFGNCQLSRKANSEYQFLKHSSVFTELYTHSFPYFLPMHSKTIHAVKLKSSKMTFVICISTFENLLVTCCTTSLTFTNWTFCPHYIDLFCVYLRINSELSHLQHKLIGFYNRDGKCLQRGTAGALNNAVCACATYSINWLVFITEVESVYSAVRTGALNNAVCASSFKD